MANRRMFAKSITNSSQFLMMPQSSQNLYFHFGMNADDDGFCEHFTIMRMTESKPDDLKILHAKGFVCIFDDKVLVIVDWKENNYLRSDRYTPSKYLQVYKDELAKVESGVPSGIPEVDTGKVRLGKVRLGNTKVEPGTSFQALEASIGPVLPFGLKEYLHSLGQGQVVMFARFNEGIPSGGHPVQAHLFHSVFDVRHSISVLN